MWEEDSEHRIISQRPEWSHLYVLCQWGLTKVGIRFNLTYLISQEERMEAIIYKLCAWRSMQTAVSEGYIFLIDSTARKSYLHNSSYSCQSKSNNEFDHNYLYYSANNHIVFGLHNLSNFNIISIFTLFANNSTHFSLFNMFTINNVCFSIYFFVEIYFIHNLYYTKIYSIKVCSSVNLGHLQEKKIGYNIQVTQNKLKEDIQIIKIYLNTKN